MSDSHNAPWPNFTQEEADAVSEVLLSGKVNYWTGTVGREFEKEFAAYTETQHAIALANGTVAIDLALYGLKIGSHNGGTASDEVIVTPRSFMASASAIVNAGARPVFVDVDRESQNITPETIEPAITADTRAILCVHLAGWPCDMDGFKDLVSGKDIKLIEDCAQAHGARYKGKSVGGLGDVAAWSFCQDKIMTTAGEGGMVTCDDEDIWRRMWAFKDHGKSWDAVYNRQHPPGYRWVIEDFGTNWRLTEMQSAVGRIQLKRMPDWYAARKKNAENLMRALEPYTDPQNGIIRLARPTCAGCNGGCTANNGCVHAFYKFYAFVRPENLDAGRTRDTIIEQLTDQGVFCQQGSCSEMYLEKAFEGSGFAPTERLSVAQELGETSLMFKVHPGLSHPDFTL